MSALIGSDGENHLHDKQFSDCHVILFSVFWIPAVVVVINLVQTPIKEFVHLVFMLIISLSW